MNAEKLADRIAKGLDAFQYIGSFLVDAPVKTDDGAVEILLGTDGKLFLITVVDLDETEVQGS